MNIQFDGIQINKRILVETQELCIKDKGITTLCGKNGVGKTLLLRKLFSISLEQGWNATFVEQSNEFIVENYSILENVALRKDEAAEDSVKNLMKEYGLEYLLHHSSSELSGGEKRLICLLRAIYNMRGKDGILFIDEPTNDLDIDHVREVISVLKLLSNQYAIVLASHDDRIIAISDRLLFIENGHITEKENEKDEE